jgi:hypothetical protein
MKNVLQHIEHAKKKPHHVKKRIVFASAGIGTAFVALIWIASSISSNAFAIKGSTFADSAVQEQVTVVDRGSNPQNLAGVAAALENKDAPAHIEIVNTSSSTLPSKQAEQTTIPF